MDQDNFPLYCKLEFIGMDPIEDECHIDIIISKNSKNRLEFYELVKAIKNTLEGKDVRIIIQPLIRKKE